MASGMAAKQLILMLWAEQQGRGGGGSVAACTYPLIRHGLVLRQPDTVSVKLTPEGRAEAVRLSETPAGQALLAQKDQAPRDTFPHLLDLTAYQATYELSDEPS